MNPWNEVQDAPPTTGRSAEYLVQLENGDNLVAAWMNIGGWDFEPASPIKYWMEIPDNLTCSGCGCPINEDNPEENGCYCSTCA